MVSSLQSNSGWVRHCGHGLSNVQSRNLEFFGKTKFTERYEFVISENIVCIFGTWNYPVNVVTSDDFSLRSVVHIIGTLNMAVLNNENSSFWGIYQNLIILRAIKMINTQQSLFHESMSFIWLTQHHWGVIVWWSAAFWTFQAGLKKRIKNCFKPNIPMPCGRMYHWVGQSPRGTLSYHIVDTSSHASASPTLPVSSFPPPPSSAGPQVSQYRHNSQNDVSETYSWPPVSFHNR